MAVRNRVGTYWYLRDCKNENKKSIISSQDMLKDEFSITYKKLEKSKVIKIGEKTRKRFLDVKLRRKEIIRIDSKEFSNSVLSKSKCANTKFVNTFRNKLIKSTLDTLVKSTNSNNFFSRSSVVRITNISSFISTDQIRNFFVGLSPMRIFSLPRHEEPIPELGDVENHVSPRLNKINRKCGVQIRLFVKFPSEIAAELACGRSGECMRTKNERDIFIEDDTNVEVFHVPKYIASYIEQYMAIDFVNGETICNRIFHANKFIHNIITSILWIMAELILKLHCKIEFLNFESVSIRVQNIKYLSIPLNFNEYQNLVDLYNSIWKIHEKVEHVHNNILVNYSPLSASADNCFYQLYIAAYNWLLDQLERVKYTILSFQITHSIQPIVLD